jgi:adenine/guanine phosphoribosyltransferase-like PRPP-binding protein
MRVVTGAVVPESSAVLIVDDVLTTGATLAQAYEVLRQAGFEVSGAAVLAATQNPR